MAIKIVSSIRQHSSGLPLAGVTISIKSCYNFFKLLGATEVKNDEGQVLIPAQPSKYFVDFCKFYFLNDATYQSGIHVFQENSRIEIPFEDISNISDYIYEYIKNENRTEISEGVYDSEIIDC